MQDLKAKFDDEYAYTSELKLKQWAWEFLRRNPDYQKDYQWFIQLWRSLEKDYGCAPDVDYQAWKQDPRCYKIIDMASAADGNCAVSDDKLLIECWMGNKWGFYQFPVSPELNALAVDITWRPLPQDYHAPENSNDLNKEKLNYDIRFDLSKSLKEQLASAKHEVLIAQRRLRKLGDLCAYTLEGKKMMWRSCLEFIDTNSVPDNCEFNPELNLDLSSELNYELISSESKYFLCNYLSILTFLQK
jgi:hypothetical protein